MHRTLRKRVKVKEIKKGTNHLLHWSPRRTYWLWPTQEGTVCSNLEKEWCKICFILHPCEKYEHYCAGHINAVNILLGSLWKRINCCIPYQLLEHVNEETGVCSNFYTEMGNLLYLEGYPITTPLSSALLYILYVLLYYLVQTVKKGVSKATTRNDSFSWKGLISNLWKDIFNTVKLTLYPT